MSMRPCALPVALLVTACSITAHAQDAGRDGGPHPPVRDDEAERLAWLERVLDREGRATRVWRGAWLGFYGGAAVVEAVIAGTTSMQGTRVDSVVNTGKATIAFVFTFFSPASAGPLADRARAMLTASRADRTAKLRAAEAALHLIAAEERDRRGWLPLVGGALLNAAGAWASFAGHKGNGGLGWLGAASGLAIAQIQFHTQPTAAIRAEAAYARAGAGARLGEPPAVLRWSIRPSARGASVDFTF